MKKKTITIITIIVIGFIFIGIGIYFSSNKKPVENTTNNATLKIDSYGTIKEEANIYLQANKESVLINTISANESVLIMSDKVYTDDDGLEYKKVLYINDKNEAFFGYMEVSKLETEEDEKSQSTDEGKDTNKDTNTETQTDNNDNNKENDEASQINKITIKNKGPLELGKDHLGYKTISLEIEEEYDDVEWTISDENVATISGTKVTGQKAGTATVKAKKGNAIDTIDIIVEDLEIPNIDEIKVQEKKSLKATVIPANAPSRNITYTSSNEKVVTIDGDGNIKGISTGKATITVTNGVVTTKKEIYVESIELPNTTEIKEGRKLSLRATLKPSAVPSRNITYTSSNNAVATVDSNGIVEGKASGSTIITATNGIVTTKKEIYVESIELANITGWISTHSITEIGNGSTKSLRATLIPANAPSRNITYTSSNTDVAEIDSNGNVTGKSPGRMTTIKATNGITTTTREVIVESIEFPNITAIVKGDTKSFKAKLIPPEGPSRNITYTSSNTDVATIDSNGNVTGKSPGYTTIIATNGITTTNKQIKIEGIEVANIGEMKAGESKNLRVQVSPLTATSKDLTYKSNNASIASVDNTGKVKAVGPGTTSIEVSNGTATANSSVTVKVPVTGISLDKNNETIGLNKTKSMKLQATISPSNADDKTIN